MAKKYPEDYPKFLDMRIQAYLMNKTLNQFCKIKKFEHGANGFERKLCDLIQEDFNKAISLVEELFKFGEKNNIEKAFRGMVIGHNSNKRQYHGERMLPCKCGSMNIRVWRMPSKAICGDCKNEFFPKFPASRASDVVKMWNMFNHPNFYEMTLEK